MAPGSALPVGRRQDGSLLWLLLSTLCRHALITGTTGWGKSGLLIGVMLGLLTRFPRAKVCLIDAKGETTQLMRDRFLPVLAQRHPHLAPDRINSIEPFGAYSVPFDPLVLAPGMDPAVKANLVCLLVGSLAEGGLGPRMSGILSWLVRVAMDVNGSLHDIQRLLVDDNYRLAVASHLQDEELRHYLLNTFLMEPRASRDSLRSRIEWLLQLPLMRAALCAGRSLSGSDLIESPITLIDLGGAPQGFAKLSQFVGAHLFQLVTGAVFSREVTQNTRPVFVFVDEWQAMAKVAADDFERLLSQARSRRVALWLANQALGQVEAVSHGLTASLMTNVALHIAFRPEISDIRHLLPLLPITGRRVDPARPDRLLTKEEERQALLSTLAKLPPRHAVLADRVAGQASIMRTLSVPFEPMRELAEKLPHSRIEQYRKGRFGVPVEQLAARPLAVSVPEPEQGSEQEDASTHSGTARQTHTPRNRRPRRRRPLSDQPELVLPE